MWQGYNRKLKTVDIRKLTLRDLPDLQKIGQVTFLETFAQNNTKEDMDKYLSESFSKEQLTKELTNPNSEFYVAVLNEVIVGYLKVNFGISQTELKDDKAIEIERIYVLKEFHGQKVGQFLYEKAIEIARTKQLEYVWLGVWEKNYRAKRFYEKNGFIPFGKHIFRLGNDEQTDIMMRKNL